MSPDALFLLGAALLGPVIGSFLNVVIHRLPKMMEAEWRAQCAELNGDGRRRRGQLQPAGAGVALPEVQRAAESARTTSRCCPMWSSAASARSAVPAISARYPAVELVTGLLSVAVAWHFGWGAAGVAALLLVWTLIALTFIDADTTFLPDDLTLPLLWAGLLVNAFGVFTPLRDAVLGAAVGYLALWTLYWLFKLATGKEGMGYGDFKLLAALGAWLGLKMLLPIVLLASVVGAVVGIVLIGLARRGKEIPIPFGPYLATAGAIALFYGDALLAALHLG